LPFAIFLLRNFFVGIPKDIMESARIDGASELTIFVRLILPLGLPAIASLAIFQFLWTWNDLIVALTFGQNVQPITVAIFSNLRQFGANIDLIAPASFISLLVPLCVFFAFQRFAVQGSSPGGSERRLDCAMVAASQASTYATLMHGGIPPEVTVFDAAGADPRGPGAAARRRSASAGCARRATATASRPPFGPRRPPAWRSGPMPLVASMRPLPPDGRGVPRACRATMSQIGWDAVVEAAGGSRVRRVHSTGTARSVTSFSPRSRH
jgi:hypothetical protein